MNLSIRVKFNISKLYFKIKGRIVFYGKDEFIGGL